MLSHKDYDYLKRTLNEIVKPLPGETEANRERRVTMLFDELVGQKGAYATDIRYEGGKVVAIGVKYRYDGIDRVMLCFFDDGERA